MSGKDRERHEQEAILNKLRKEGLVLRPESKASGGVAFELVSAETEEKPSTKGATRKLPPLLQKKKRKNKEHSRVTKESILDKLEKAEDRRKKQVEEKVRKAKAFLEEACPSRKPVEEANITHVVKMASKIESRDKRLEDMVRKLKAKEEHAERVRRRKLLRQATIQDSTEAPI
nr:uncharacterized protein LOC119164927 [Rhipicephalus microplus]